MTLEDFIRNNRHMLAFAISIRSFATRAGTCRRAWGIALLAAVLALDTSWASAQAPGTDPSEAPMSAFVTQLFTPEFCDSTGRKSIGIWTFDADRIPVPVNVADRIYASALNTLIINKPNCVDVLDGSAIREIAELLKRTGAFREAGENPLLALEKANRDVAVLIRGEIFAQDGAVFVSFRAVERERGVVLAQSKPWQLPEDYIRSAAEDTALSLDVALQRAANQLVAKASAMQVLVPLGIYYQDTGAQPPLARYILDGLLGAIENETTSLLSGARLRIMPPELRLAAKTGTITTVDDFDPLAGAGGRIGESVYELTGRYWQVGDAIDLKLSLRSQAAELVTWQGRVRLAGLPDLAATPTNNALGMDGESAFLLQITSPRGAAPYYQPGEALTVFLRSDRDAWLSCFYIDAAGSVIMVLPNTYQTDRSAQSRISAGVLRALPDARQDPFEFRFTANTFGEEALRCYATTGDPGPHLPEPLKSGGFTPLTVDLARRLGALFRSLPDMLVAEAVLTVTVGPDDPPAELDNGGS